jgi:hypothetical protein
MSKRKIRHKIQINNVSDSSMPVPISLNATLTESLPAKGWIKPCLLCTTPTSKFYIVFESGKLYKCHFCKNCFKHKNSILELKYSYAIRKEINVYEYLGEKYTEPGR